MIWLVRLVKPWSIAFLALSTLCLHLISLTVSSILISTYDIYNEIIPHKKETIIVGGMGLAPFTTLINVELVKRELMNMKGIRILPETLVLAIVNHSHVVVIRGLNFVFPSSSNISAKEVECLYCASIGSGLAQKLGIGRGDTLSILSPFENVPMMLKVVTVVKAPPPYKYEILVPRETASAIRNAPLYEASYIVITYNPKIANATEVLNRLGIKNIPKPLIERLFVAVMKISKRIKAVSGTPSEIYMARLGIRRDAIVASSIALSMVLLYAYYMLGSAFALANNELLEILYNVGVSKRKVARCLMIIALMLTVTMFVCACIAGLTMLYKSLHLSILGYELIPHFSTLTIFSVLIASSIATTYGVWRGASVD